MTLAERVCIILKHTEMPSQCCLQGDLGAVGKIRQVNGVLVVDLAGPLDAATAQQVKSELQALIDGGNVRLVLNLSRMDFIDSAGLGVLVSCLRRAAGGGGDLRLADVPPFCRSIFELTRLTRVFDVNESEEQAIRAIQQ